jgi:hypothetical protein
VFRAQAGDIYFTVGTFYERASPFAEKNAAASLSYFSVRGAARRYFSRQVAQHFRWKSDSKMNVQAACALNTLYSYVWTNNDV